ncbi:hypothetical protein N9C62_02840 [Luminiphilus sp.]|nr:hypothetical protein [Luminiphilus sp.]
MTHTANPAALLVLLLLLLLSSVTVAQKASDVYRSEFYRDQGDYSAPGQLLTVESLPEKQSLAAADENLRGLSCPH